MSPSPNPRTRELLGLAGAYSRRPGGIPELLRQELAASRIEDYICKVAQSAPVTLSPEQLDRIIATLRNALSERVSDGVQVSK